MTQKIFDALMLTRKTDPNLFAEVIILTKGKRSVLEFNLPEVSRMPWEETSSDDHGVQKFTTRVDDKQVVLTLEPVTNHSFVVKGVKQV